MMDRAQVLQKCSKSINNSTSSSSRIHQQHGFLASSSSAQQTLPRMRKDACAAGNRRVKLAEMLDRRSSIGSLASLLKRCGETKALSDGKLVHAHINRYKYHRNTFLGNCLVQMYGNCGSLNEARAVFDALPKLNLYSWTILMNAYVKNGCGQEALKCFHQMQICGVKPDNVAFVCALDACASLQALDKGRMIHACIVESGCKSEVIVGTALVNMYGKCGSLTDARRVFDRIIQQDVVSWSAMIAAYSQNGHGKDALDLFHSMQRLGIKPNNVTFVSALDACTGLLALEQGQEIHRAISKAGYEGQVVVNNALINMYGKCGSLDKARSVFCKMPESNVVSWSSIIAACSLNGHYKESLDLLDRMHCDGINPNEATFVSALDACVGLAALEKGQEIHAAIIKSGYEGHILVGTAIVNMYGKCGSLENARTVFSRMPERNVVSWSAMIAACAQNGHSEEALELFHQMQCSGIKPNEITFLSVLSACSHTGRVDDGKYYFQSMRHDHGLTPKVDHYECLITILGRAGYLADAEDLINDMPYDDKARVWLSLLGACRAHVDVERGLRAANNVLKLDPENDAPYTLLAKLYTAAGRWDDAKQVKQALRTTCKLGVRGAVILGAKSGNM